MKINFIWFENNLFNFHIIHQIRLKITKDIFKFFRFQISICTLIYVAHHNLEK